MLCLEEKLIDLWPRESTEFLGPFFVFCFFQTSTKLKNGKKKLGFPLYIYKLSLWPKITTKIPVD